MASALRPSNYRVEPIQFLRYTDTIPAWPELVKSPCVAHSERVYVPRMYDVRRVRASPGYAGQEYIVRTET